MTWWFTTFSAPEVKNKVHFLTGVEYLYDSVSPEQLDIPQFIMDCDTKVSHYNLMSSKSRINRITDRGFRLGLKDVNTRYFASTVTALKSGIRLE